ncbi:MULTISPECIES: flavin reductase family protein [Bacillus]|uniref:flavin reductase family protein n=1 Tax=Bacillus TaxID=1386 RepID=UPI002244C4B1|nr:MULTISPECIES: flavin reductase family protein [Bacillus]MDN5390072.1 flavin reductase family protein [Bacillus sp. LB7]MEC1021480.1 flavin reductase family protein [Bacillus paralicheniformis]MEC1024528.1 flavin reductase family protein [Bacillus paralicheniformis]MEC1034647.1 flavin reductase family protein [Bacillus paralicheniformis]MEC1049292.1 flavin reductase family protein [Bacillus paralicheniformis]
MLSIDPNTKTERENYKFLIGSIIPRPVAFVTSLSEEGVLNGAPFSYFNIVSSNPPMISLSIQRFEGSQKDTARNILNSKEFVVHIVDEQNVEKMNLTAASLPPSQSEVQFAELTPVESVKVSVPGVKEAKVRMECVLEYSLELGVKHSDGCDFMIGRVVQYHIESSIYENGKIDPKGLGAISRLAGHDYAKIGEIFTRKRSK